MNHLFFNKRSFFSCLKLSWLFVIFPLVGSAQVPEFLIGDADSAYVTNYEKKWSIRAYSIIKTQQLKFSDPLTGVSTTFLPNNVTAVGVGVSYYTLLLDLGINLNLEKEKPSDRFDLQGNLIVQAHFITYHLQKYGGFDTHQSKNAFIRDLETLNVGITYQYMFNHDRISLAAGFNGIQKQKQSAGSFGLGFFFAVLNLKADTSYLPGSMQQDLNMTYIRKRNTINTGFSASYQHIFVLPFDLFIFAGLGPGIGLQLMDAEAEKWYKPSGHGQLMYHLNTRLAFGYNGPDLYVNASFFNQRFINSHENSLNSRLDVVKLKLALGYRF
ncbi:MAG: DUF4421 family protein [Candidatus Cyclobacteriaceae bacterium M3_2C_046]